MTNFNTTFESQWGEAMPSKASRGARVAIILIRTYQQLRAGRVSPCRFYPSCSAYSAEAIATHGVVRGGLLSLRRLLRCRPLGPHGVDLVPQSQKVRTIK
jgi:putative membrane protein insertion efficiency factor